VHSRLDRVSELQRPAVQDNSELIVDFVAGSHNAAVVKIMTPPKWSIEQLVALNLVIEFARFLRFWYFLLPYVAFIEHFIADIIVDHVAELPW